MKDIINNIINRYQIYSELYEVLKDLYVKSEISQEQYDHIIKKIKKIIVSFYLHKFKFKTYQSGEVHDDLLIRINEICDFERKIKNNDGKIKIYPIKESDGNKENYYQKILEQMVDYQIETNIGIEDIFVEYANLLKAKLTEIKKRIKTMDMNLYYGSPYYMIERAKYIVECLKYIPDISLNVDELINPMLSFENKYLEDRTGFSKTEDFIIENDQFYEDYDLIESCYKRLIVIEAELAPVVIGYWKQYLTNPNEHSDLYRYITHSFSGGMVEPSMMRKACCSLSTNEIENKMYGSAGLIYTIDVEAVDTMCTGDAGSWVLNKEEFIDRGCPGSWQLTKLNGQAVWYECPRNSKLIMPNQFEEECKKQIANGTWSYSEFFLNGNAKPIGVFYTDRCENLSEVQEYAEKYNLPLVKVKEQTNEFKLT